jgi:hypothetical protein
MLSRADILFEPSAEPLPSWRSVRVTNPIAPKVLGWNNNTIGVAAKSELIEKYHGKSVDLNGIEESDYVWHDGLLSPGVPTTFTVPLPHSSLVM